MSSRPSLSKSPATTRPLALAGAYCVLVHQPRLVWYSNESPSDSQTCQVAVVAP